MTDTRRRQTRIEVEQVEVLSDRQVEQLHVLYQNEWWSKGRGLNAVRTMLANTDVIVTFVEPSDQRLVAFARVLTDFTFQALIFDVIVAPNYRSQGMGRRLMDAIMQHAALAHVTSFWLCCLPELVPFYEKWGFIADLNDVKWMRCVPNETALN